MPNDSEKCKLASVLQQPYNDRVVIVTTTFSQVIKSRCINVPGCVGSIDDSVCGITVHLQYIIANFSPALTIGVLGVWILTLLYIIYASFEKV